MTSVEYAPRGGSSYLPAASDAVYYVSVNGNDANDGLSWGSAFATLAKAFSMGSAAVEVGAGTFSFSASLLPQSGTRITGRGRQTTVLSYTGTGAIVSFGANVSNTAWASLTLTQTSNASTCSGLSLVNDGNFNNLFFDVLFSAAAKTAGQVGVNVLATNNVYWNKFIACRFLNWNIAVTLDSNSTANANANQWVGCTFGNFQHGFNLIGAAENIISACSFDTFTGTAALLQGGSRTVGNTFSACRAEGGAGSQTFSFGAGTTLNEWSGFDNCPTASIDSGTNNRVLITALNKLTQIQSNSVGVGFNGNAPVAKAGAIASPTAPSASYVQAEAASAKTAIDAIRAALQAVGITA